MRSWLRQALLLVAAAAVFAGTLWYTDRVLEPRRREMLQLRYPLAESVVHAAEYSASRAAGGEPRFIPGEREPLSGEGGALRADLSSRAIAVSLGGLRGLFTIYLWVSAENQKNLEIHEDLLDKYYRIADLQPDYPQVYSFHAWNLAYNLAAQWSTVERRYEWVREGIRFLQDGRRRNPQSLEILETLGRIYYWKIYQQSDPEDREYMSRRVREDDGASPLYVAYRYYSEARRIMVETGRGHPQFSDKIMFSQPCHALHDYAKEQTERALATLETAAEAQLDGQADAETIARRGLDQLREARNTWRAAVDEWGLQARRFPDDNNAYIFGNGAKRSVEVVEECLDYLTINRLAADPDGFLTRARSAADLDPLIRPLHYQWQPRPEIVPD